MFLEFGSRKCYVFESIRRDHFFDIKQKRKKKFFKPLKLKSKNFSERKSEK